MPHLVARSDSLYANLPTAGCSLAIGNPGSDPSCSCCALRPVAHVMHAQSHLPLASPSLLAELHCIHLVSCAQSSPSRGAVQCSAVQGLRKLNRSTKRGFRFRSRSGEVLLSGGVRRGRRWGTARASGQRRQLRPSASPDSDVPLPSRTDRLRPPSPTVTPRASPSQTAPPPRVAATAAATRVSRTSRPSRRSGAEDHGTMTRTGLSFSFSVP